MKKIFAVVLCMAMIFALAACGGSTTPAASAPAASAPAASAPAASAPAAAGSDWVDVGPYTNTTETQGKSNDLVIIISNGAGESAPVVQACLTHYAPLIENNSKGRIGVEVYSNGQIGNDTVASEMIIAGQLEAAIPSTAPLVGYVPELAIFDMPFLFADEAEADYVLSSELADYIDAKLADKGVMNLAWAENGFRELTNSKVIVKSADDIVGLKIRTMENAIHQEIWNSLGATATPMSTSELYTALEQKVVDGEENPVANFYSYQFQEVQKNVCFTNHVYSPFVCIYSKQIWDGYDQETQAIIKDAAEQYAVEEKRVNREQADICLQSCINDYGMEATYPDEAMMQTLRDKTAHVADMIAETTGQEVFDLLNKVKAARK